MSRALRIAADATLAVLTVIAIADWRHNRHTRTGDRTPVRDDPA